MRGVNCTLYLVKGSGKVRPKFSNRFAEPVRPKLSNRFGRTRTFVRTLTYFTTDTHQSVHHNWSCQGPSIINLSAVRLRSGCILRIFKRPSLQVYFDNMLIILILLGQMYLPRRVYFDISNYKKMITSYTALVSSTSSI